LPPLLLLGHERLRQLLVLLGAPQLLTDIVYRAMRRGEMR
jgi:hypothetical protein